MLSSIDNLTILQDIGDKLVPSCALLDQSDHESREASNSYFLLGD